MTRRGGLTRNRIFTDGLLSYIKRPGRAGRPGGAGVARRTLFPGRAGIARRTLFPGRAGKPLSTGIPGGAGGPGRGDVKRKAVNNHLFNNKSLSHYNKKPSRAT